jgi:bacteriocin biosynthesis cyclodehydratase domain-containing protein
MLSNYDIFEDKENNVYQIRTKGDVFLVRFEGDEKKEIFLHIIKITREKNHSFKDLMKALKNKFEESKVMPVINELKESGIFNEYYTNPKKDVKGLALGLLGKQDFSRLKTEKTLEVIGSGELFDAFKKITNKGDFGSLNFTKIGNKNNEALIEKAFKRSDLVIVESNRWNPNFLEKVNQIALIQNKPWMLVRGMWRGYGSIGPLFYGKETGCYECLSARVKSNIEHLQYFLAYERHLKEEDKSAQPDWAPTGFHEIIASSAIFDGLKFLTEWDVPETYNNIVNFLPSLTTEKHKLLKNPLCGTCKPELEYNLSPWIANIALK